ncbi:hypothetical protein GWI33_004508 [Rhynchophorus ferrugineus]|uniref:Uncharacterized protein n=1 Tax=Rhynchophorus ferrugineus TaxID=354439 RepID=A0A834IM70_RHYFE|nr:hypothetical protein GWI33_004508 [Rhynchophorus ferrugineus]
MNHSTIYILVFFGFAIISEASVRTTSRGNSFEYFAEENTFSPELQQAFKPAEDAILGFIHKLANTGYASSKIALSKLERQSQSQRDITDQMHRLLELLPGYKSKIPVVDDMPKLIKETN